MITKKQVYITIVACLLAIPLCSLSAQSLRRDQEHEFAIGVNGGMNFSRVSFLHNDIYRINELGNQSMKTGYRLGVVFRYINQKHFGVQIEANYLKAGWSEKFHEDEGFTMVNEIDLQDVKLSRSFSFIEIPALAHIYFGKKKFRFFIELGPELSIMTQYGELKWNIPDDDERKAALLNDDPRLHEDHNKLNYGLAAGLGFDILIGRCHAIIGGRYTFGFKDLYDNAKSDVFQRSNNQWVGVTASFLWSVVKFTEKSQVAKKLLE